MEGAADITQAGRWTLEAGVPLAEICPTPDDTPLQTRIRGAKGTSVVLRLRNEAGEDRDAEVTRDRIETSSVLGARVLDAGYGIGYVRIDAFQATTARDLRKAIEELLEGGMKALILDLRQNRGGLMDQAVEIADFFLAEGVIVRQRGRRSEFTETYEASAKRTISADLALALLVDGDSASASEILASALQDHRRAVLVGTRTYG